MIYYLQLLLSGIKLLLGIKVTFDARYHGYIQIITCKVVMRGYIQHSEFVKYPILEDR